MKSLNQITLFSILFIALNAQASPIQWHSADGGNDHWYEYVSYKNTWKNARIDALNTTFNGLAGYLTTITSAEENDFILTLATQGWIGATDQDSEGTWIWADGPEAGENFWNKFPSSSVVDGYYADWDYGVGQPNNSGNEDYAEIYSRNIRPFPGAARVRTYFWNDRQTTSQNAGYVIEFSSDLTTIPNPSTLWLLSLGLIALVARQTRRSFL